MFDKSNPKELEPLEYAKACTVELAQGVLVCPVTHPWMWDCDDGSSRPSVDGSRAPPYTLPVEMS